MADGLQSFTHYQSMIFSELRTSANDIMNPETYFCFTVQRYATGVLAVVVLSVRLSVRHKPVLYHKRSKKTFNKKPNRRQKILRRSQDRGKAVDKVFSVGKVVQFLLYGKNASIASRKYVRHA